MRERKPLHDYLFRGKALCDGEWEEGNLFIQNEEALPPQIQWSNEKSRIGINVDPDTVSMWTGLTDKAGGRIYEGDIVTVQRAGMESYLFVVMFGPCGGVPNADHPVGYVGFHFAPAIHAAFGLRGDPLYWLNAYDVWVVGNRWDNPELLEVPADG